MENPISILIIAKNEENRIADCIRSGKFAGEILVLDNDSTDRTAEISRNSGAKVIHYKSANFSELRNEIQKYAKSEWLMYLDADEIITDGLKSEIIRIITSGKSDSAAYFVKRKTYYYGNYLWPEQDRVQRLFLRKNFLGWSGELHETPHYRGNVSELVNPLIHYTHQNLADMIDKTNKWSDIEAKLRFDAKHPRISWWRLIRVMVTGFCDSYFNKSGYKAGVIGIIEGIYQAFSMFLTYAKLWERQQKRLK
jgi:glycosyltransferase involved in cell wall biosynthesis